MLIHILLNILRKSEKQKKKVKPNGARKKGKSYGCEKCPVSAIKSDKCKRKM